MTPMDMETGHATVLVVDDVLANRELARGCLEIEGYEVIVAEDGAQALDMYTDFQPDLVLLDVMMPVMDGFEACERLRQLPGGDDLPILFLTALSDTSTHERAVRSGATDFLNKPLNRTELALRVKSLLRIRQLGRFLRESNEDLRAQRNQLMVAQKQKRALMDFVVHDLKTPLSVVSTGAEILLSRGTLEGMAADLAHDMVAAAKTMQRMVLDLLDLSREEEGRLVAKRAPTDVAQVTESLCRQSVERYRRAGRELTWSVSPERYEASVDRGLLERTLSNLIDNALKYAPKGSEVSVTFEASERHLCWSVADLGPGIPPEKREEIFAIYGQIGSDRGDHGSANRGLGLAFCRAAVAAQSGEIRVEANDPQGSRFVFELPV